MFRTHGKRILRQLGATVPVGARSYRLRGYFSNRMADDFQHEPYLVGVIRRVLEERIGAFIDIGANTGQTLLKVLAVDPDRRYVGFEPLLPCAHFMQQFILDNQLKNASVLPIALSDVNALVAFHFNSGFDEMASLVPEMHNNQVFVQARIGDQVLKELNLDPIAMIKIDVEGAESQVLTGLEKTLDSVKPTVLFEQLPNFEGHERTRMNQERARRNTEAAGRVWDLLTAHNYRICQIDYSGNEQEIRSFSLDDKTNYRGRDFIAHPI